MHTTSVTTYKTCFSTEVSDGREPSKRAKAKGAKREGRAKAEKLYDLT